MSEGSHLMGEVKERDTACWVMAGLKEGEIYHLACDDGVSRHVQYLVNGNGHAMLIS